MSRCPLLLVLLLLLLAPPWTSSLLMGWVESPGYPSGYPAHSHLTWSRCAPPGHRLSLRLLHLDLEDSEDCEDDALKISSDQHLLSLLCGTRSFEELHSSINPSLFSSSGGCLSLSFHSDFSNQRRHSGFRGFYTLTDFDECEDDPENRCSHFCHNVVGGYHCSCRHGYHLDKDNHTCTVSCGENLSGLDQGLVSSPFWPRFYSDSSHCETRLSVEDHLQLEISFSQTFDLEQSHDGHCIDTLEILTPSQTFGPFCGSAPPPSPLLLQSHQASILFTSDSSGSNRGFSLRFRTRGKTCPSEVTSHSSLTPVKHQYEGGQTVTVTCNLGYITDTGLHSLSTQYESTCQRKGAWSPRHTCQPVNCGPPEVPSDGVLTLVGSGVPQTKYQDQIQFTCSSEYYVLDGDDTFTCGADGEWASASGETRMPRCKAVCGKPQKVVLTASRILGGQKVKLGEIPWQLLIRHIEVSASNQRPYISWVGSASLISDRWAVTAAHVLDVLNPASLQLRGSLVKIWEDGAVLTAERVVVHPGYSRTAEARYDHDIALIRFASRVPLGPTLLPVCLPEAPVQENQVGTVSGWGTTETRNISRLLQYTQVGVYATHTCRDTPPGPSGTPLVFTNNMLCAGGVGSDSCWGDSGGPLVLPPITAGTGPYHLVGVVSWGEHCRNQGNTGHNKGYYTKVENYVEWIRNTIEEDEGS